MNNFQLYGGYNVKLSTQTLRSWLNTQAKQDSLWSVKTQWGGRVERMLPGAINDIQSILSPSRIQISQNRFITNFRSQIISATTF